MRIKVAMFFFKNSRPVGSIQAEKRRERTDGGIGNSGKSNSVFKRFFRLLSDDGRHI